MRDSKQGHDEHFVTVADPAPTPGAVPMLDTPATQAEKIEALTVENTELRAKLKAVEDELVNQAKINQRLAHAVQCVKSTLELI